MASCRSTIALLSSKLPPAPLPWLTSFEIASLWTVNGFDTYNITIVFQDFAKFLDVDVLPHLVLPRSRNQRNDETENEDIY